jgi:hypothetical protein
VSSTLVSIDPRIYCYEKGEAADIEWKARDMQVTRGREVRMAGLIHAAKWPVFRTNVFSRLLHILLLTRHNTIHRWRGGGSEEATFEGHWLQLGPD